MAEASPHKPKSSLLKSEELERWHQVIGIISIFLAAIGGTSSLYALMKENVALWAKLSIGLISYAAAVFTGLQTFFKLSERAAQHYAVAARYGVIHRTIERVQTFPPGDHRSG